MFFFNILYNFSMYLEEYYVLEFPRKSKKELSKVTMTG